MSEGEETQKRTNRYQGRACKRIRRAMGLTQQQLGDLIGMTAQTVDRHEDKAVLSEDILQLFSKGLKVPVEFIKNLEEDQPLIYVENNTFAGNGTASGVIENSTINQKDKTSEALLQEIQKSNETLRIQYEDILSTYKQMIESYKEQIKRLENRLDRLEKQP